MTGIKNLDEKVPVEFSFDEERGIKNRSNVENCPHPYKLVKDGFNYVNGREKQRYKCNLCGSRLGNKHSVPQIKRYKRGAREIIYDLFIMKASVSRVAEKYGIPQPKVSEFKKRVIRQAYSQNKRILERPSRKLPDGVMFGDETYFGTKDNHNMEMEFVSNESKVLALGPVEKKGLFRYISGIFYSIPADILSNLKVFVSDGEPAYKRLMRGFGRDVIDVQQLHDPDKLGTVLINRYENLGAHMLQYQVETHWKIFSKGKCKIKVNWSKKLIRGQMYSKRGRPSKEQVKAAWSAYQGRRWRQNYKKYREVKSGETGTAEMFINPETNKVSPGAGSQTWMSDLLTPLLKLFKGKCVSSNVVEGVHSRIKRHQRLRKQQDPVYQHQEYVFHTYISEHGHLPEILLRGKYLWKYLTITKKRELVSYELESHGQTIIQTSLMAFVPS